EPRLAGNYTCGPSTRPSLLFWYYLQSWTSHSTASFFNQQGTLWNTSSLLFVLITYSFYSLPLSLTQPIARIDTHFKYISSRASQVSSFDTPAFPYGKG